MKQKSRTIMVAAMLLLGSTLCAQVQWDGVRNYRLNPAAPGSRSFTIGDAYAGAGQSALNVRGDLLGAGFNTGEVFRTDAPTANSTYWRMFRGGTQYGLLYNLTGSTDFNGKALSSTGNLWLRNSLDNGLRLNSGTTTATIGIYGSNPTNSFVGIGPGGGIIGTQGPWSRLHLDDGGGVLTASYRPWMKNGMYMSGNNDMMYVGQLYRAGYDESDAIVAWGDNALTPAGPDHLRFLFMGDPAIEGLEVTRITGNGEFGIGDFNTPNVEPSERLHVYNGRVRIQRLPDDPQMEQQAPTKVMVVDNTAAPSAQRGVVKWRDANSLDCKWNITVGLVNHVYTAVGAPTVPCPDDFDAVAVGVDLSATGPWAKFNVAASTFTVAQEVRNTNTGAGKVGVRARMTGGSGSSSAFDAVSAQGPAAGADNRGISITATGNGTNNTNINYGLRADLTGGSRWTRGVSAQTAGGLYTEYAGEFLSYGTPQYAYGVLAECNGGGTLDSYGVRGTANTNSPGNYGVVGSVTATGANYYAGVTGSAPVAANSWAVVSLGNQLSTTGPNWSPSDENLKTGIEDFTGGLERLMQLRPKTYHYEAEQYASLHLPTEPQVGFLAQDVAEVLPDLVRDVRMPAQFDPQGSQTSEAVEFKAMQSGSLIPYLVSAVQELKQQNDALSAQVQSMAESLAACCVGSQGTDQRVLVDENGVVSGLERMLTIQPNPFSAQTTLYYTLEHSGRMQLVANSADGKQLRVLHEAALEAGQYQHEWHTSDLSPGVYYVTLLLDGEAIVKKAVKVTR